MRLLNAVTRERIYKMQALNTFCRRIQPDVDEDSRKVLAELCEQTSTLLETWKADLSKETLEGLDRYMRHHQLTVGPRGVFRDKEYIVNETDMRELMKDIDFGCRLCMKTPLAVKRCKRRKLLERMGLEGMGSLMGNCDFERGILDIDNDA